jgi:hypothetical protein
MPTPFFVSHLDEAGTNMVQYIKTQTLVTLEAYHETSNMRY